MTGVGDRLYMSGNFVSQYRGHSNAPLTYAPGAMLRNVYMHCQHHGRICICQNYGYNTQDVRTEIDIERTLRASTSAEWVGFAKGYRIIPENVDYLVAWACFALYDFAETEVKFRLRVSDDAWVTEDNDISTQILNTAVISSAVARDGRIVTSENQLAQMQADYPYTSGFRVRDQTVEGVKFDDAAPGNKAEIRLEVMANKWTGASYAVPTELQPIAAIVAWQMRYS